MIKLTLEECKSFKFSPIQYELEEIRIRELNVNLIYNLIDISQDETSLNILNRNDLQNIKDIPYKLIKFYQTYIGTISEEVNPKTIINKIKKEKEDLEVKIRNFAEKWSFEEKYIMNELKTNELLLLSFVKEPGKQTFHQHFAAKYLSSLPLIENFEQLPSGGNEALYVVNGKIVKGKDKDDQKTGKSIDFKWEYTFNGKNLTFYATHKYTKSAGGSQDNQYKDVQEFHTESRNCINENILLLSITDGPYYLLKETSVKKQNLTKLEYLSKQYKGFRNLATTTNTLIKDISIFIIQWLTINFDKNLIEEEIEKINNLIKDLG